MKKLSIALSTAALFLPALADAHPGNHAGGEIAAWLRHMLFSPDHLPMLIVALLAIAIAVVLIDRRAARRNIKSLKRLPK